MKHNSSTLISQVHIDVCENVMCIGVWWVGDKTTLKKTFSLRSCRMDKEAFLTSA
jgi:hypothetical protein